MQAPCQAVENMPGIHIVIMSFSPREVETILSEQKCESYLLWQIDKLLNTENSMQPYPGKWLNINGNFFIWPL